jgi:hypothetical protein
MLLLSDVADLVLLKHPEYDSFDYIEHSSNCWTVIVFEEHRPRTVYRVHLSLDGRLTLSPVA